MDVRGLLHQLRLVLQQGKNSDLRRSHAWGKAQNGAGLVPFGGLFPFLRRENFAAAVAGGNPFFPVCFAEQHEHAARETGRRLDHMGDVSLVPFLIEILQLGFPMRLVLGQIEASPVRNAFQLAEFAWRVKRIGIFHVGASGRVVREFVGFVILSGSCPHEGLEHQVETSRFGQFACVVFAGMFARLPWAFHFTHVVRPKPGLAGAAIDHWIVESRHVAGCLPDLGILDDRGVEPHDLELPSIRPRGWITDHVTPPRVPEVVLQFDPERAEVPETVDSTVDLRCGKNESPAFTERYQAVHGGSFLHCRAS